jgi:hypothetical protein
MDRCNLQLPMYIRSLDNLKVLNVEFAYQDNINFLLERLIFYYDYATVKLRDHCDVTISRELWQSNKR